MAWNQRALLFPADSHAEPEGGMTVTFADIPEAITFGADRQDAMAQAVAALDLAVGEYLLRGEPAASLSRYRPLHFGPALAWGLAVAL